MRRFSALNDGVRADVRAFWRMPIVPPQYRMRIDGLRVLMGA
jgi:hypothetical protein